MYPFKVFYSAIVSYLDALIARQKKSLFVILANVSYAIREKKTRFKSLSDDFGYTVSENIAGNEICLKFYDEFYGYYIYRNGLGQRIENLAKAYLLDYVPLTSGASIIDCGANVGDFFFALKSKVDNISTYIGIEPENRTFTCLQQNIPGKIHFNVAAADSNEIKDFFVSEDLASSSLIRPRFSQDSIQIHVRTLDSIMDELKFSQMQSDLLKVEAEGLEPEVLRGAAKTLLRTKFVVVDVGPERGQSCETTLVDVVNFMGSLNFELIKCGYPRLVVLFKNRTVVKI